jgi:hypothetical protein
MRQLQLEKHKLASTKTHPDATLDELHPSSKILLHAGYLQMFITYFHFPDWICFLGQCLKNHL